MDGERAGERYQRREEARDRRRTKIKILLGGVIVLGFVIGSLAALNRSARPVPAANQAQTRSFQPVDAYFAGAEKLFPTYEIQETFGDVSLLRSDVRREVADLFGNLDIPPADAEAQATESLRMRYAMASRAIAVGMSEESDFQAAVRRYYIDTLAGQYLNWKLTAAVEVPSSDIEAFIAENPQFFAERRRFSFDAVDVPASAYSALNSQLGRSAESIEDMLVLIKGLGISYRRRPFALYSEEMPDPLLAVMDDVIDADETVFLRSDGQTTIARLIAVDPAAVPLDEWYPLARARLTTMKRAEMLASVEADIRKSLFEVDVDAVSAQDAGDQTIDSQTRGDDGGGNDSVEEEAKPDTPS